MQTITHKTASIWALGLRSKQVTQYLAHLVAVLALLSTQPSLADTVYLSQDAFLQETFHTDIKPEVIWLDNSLQQEITKVLGHSYPQARLRYWRQADTRVWVLDEIGKEYPITAGFVVQGDQISRAQVLIYRETRGMEIHSPGFLAQFNGSALKDQELTRKVDAIAGATLSTQAMIKMAKVALILSQKVSSAGHQ